MILAAFLDKLGYADSPHFLRRDTAAFSTAIDFGHVFRKATNPKCGLEGVYALGRKSESQTESVVPVVYVCHVDTDAAAKMVHRLVWNQDVVPYIIVHSPEGVRLYNGFKYGKEGVQKRGQVQSDGY